MSFKRVCRWSDSGPSLPRLSSADHAGLLNHRDLLMQSGATDVHAPDIDLFSGVASIGTLADLGLPRLSAGEMEPQVTLRFETTFPDHANLLLDKAWSC